MSIAANKLELVRGSGNVFADHGDSDADVKQMKGILAAKIISILGQQSLTVRQAPKQTGIAVVDSSRIRYAELGRFTVDRLGRIINLLDVKTEVIVQLSVRPSFGVSP